MKHVGFYDLRPAEKLVRARKYPDGHRLSGRDWDTLKQHADHMTTIRCVPGAKLVSYHKRRRRSVWDIGGTILRVVTRYSEFRGEIVTIAFGKNTPEWRGVFL